VNLGLDTLKAMGLLTLLWLVISALTAPLEALGWWAGWFGEGIDEKLVPPEEETERPENKRLRRRADYFIVFLTGIAGVRSELYLPEERALLARLTRQLPEAIIVDTIFPYSVTNRALTSQRLFAWFWRYAFRQKEHRRRIGFLINIRNLFQVLVSADHRFGPIYNQGTAETIIKGLRRHGYPPGSGTPVILIGYSGGGQIALGAAGYLDRQLAAPIRVISLGGVMCSDPGLQHVEHLYHIRGQGDGIQRLSHILFPGRWPLMANSFWSQAAARGKISLVDMGMMVHHGPGGYLDEANLVAPGHSYMDETVATLCRLVREPFDRNSLPDTSSI
jgi:hypothetical protein